MTRAPIKRHGGKAYTAKWICGLLPKHDAYIEPFCGSAAVLFAKPKGTAELIGDVDSGVIWTLRAIRDAPGTFAGQLKEMQYDEPTFIKWRDSPAANVAENDLAIRQFVVSNMSRGGLGETFAWSDRPRGGRPGDLNAWLTKLDLIPRLSRRLADVRIVERDAIEVVRDANTDALIYADPPYLHATRTAKSAYAHEMTDAHHAELLDLLDAHAGPVALSGYANPMYDDRLKHWARHTKEMANHAGQNKAKQRRVEVLWVKEARP